MKILMTADPIGGVWTYALELCEALQAYGCEILLATLGASLSPGQRGEVAQMRNVSLHESTFRLEWMDSPWQSLSEAAYWLQALEHEFDPDVIHFNHLAHGELPWSSPVMVAGHSCVLSWWAAVRRDAPSNELAIYRERVSRSLRAADLVVAPTSQMLSSLEFFYGPFQRAQVIHNGRTPGHFPGGVKEPLILSAGRLWDEAKNIGALCDIAPQLAWPVFVAGAAAEPDGDRRLLPGVNALGHLTSAQLATWYARASIYALPARYEPFGLTALEAALSGCALVLGDLASLREVWGSDASYVPPDDSAALLKLLDALIQDPALRQAYAARAALRAQSYLPEKLASAYWNAYRSLLEVKESAGCASYSSITP
jgi:glycogen synthase